MNQPRAKAPGWFISVFLTYVNERTYGIPSQLPEIGMSPGTPNPNTISAYPIVLLLRSRNVPLRYTPIVSVPLLSQSPTTGLSPPMP